ncbi:Serine/threonine-protein phosphatase bsl1 [Mortierella alpina]|nr:Serine/threonine-protein phosphatase bsl1 [Mortierella alpina]
MFVFGGMVMSADLMTESPTAELWSVGGYLTSSSSNSTSSNSTSSNSTEPGKQAPPGLSPGMAGWQKLASPQVGSSARFGHTATLVRSNGLLVIVGGVSGGALVPMSEILVYDTAAGVWSVQTATGATPPLRRNHVAVASSNGQIYVHGGTDMGATNYFADTAILDTTSWSWSQPAIEGTAPTGRYSHSAAMVGSNMVVTFGLTAGGATNNIFILDTTSNTWVTSYTPNNLQATSTDPKDWPGYKPPPLLPIPPEGDDPNRPPQNKNNSHVGPIVGGVAGVFAIAALVFVLVRRHRRHHQLRGYQAKMASYYGRDFSNQQNIWQEDAYRPTGMAFESAPTSFGQRVEQFWGDGMAAMAFWRTDRRAANRSQSHRIRERDDDASSMRGLQEGGPISDQDIFMDAVHRARSRIGRLSPIFSPLQQPLATPGSPSSPRSPRHSGSGFGSPGRAGGDAGVGVYVPCIAEEDENVPHGRAYSDGFENAMLEMDVQMLAVPRGRLYVVNPSDETLTPQQDLGQAEQQAYEQFDSQRPRE